MVDQNPTGPLPAANEIRKRLRECGDSHLGILAETLTDEQIDRLLQWEADGTLQKIRDDQAH